MKKIGIMNSNIAAKVADMGHMDWLAVGDAGTPVPEEVDKIDLCVKSGTPSFIEVLDVILSELEVQKIYLAEEIKVKNPDVLKQINERFDSNISIEFISHNDLKKNIKKSKAFVRTGEMTPFANIILESGVIF